ncbi:transglutaminase family protein [Fertoebacter nigrum]|uniref:Transglutaminase family protein n=1 Tax=Fertoeibacter niger TaxID=2656921 RepID=A0A8X8H0P1_9RHOB|nr:transglutaminase family protein [Fertoeibacter niger]NUB44830.1 transglutaminase family protein [Fertoeibacter niger]
MLYHIRLSITYDYDSPAMGGRHLLRLLPLDIPGEQEVTAPLLAISPRPTERGSFTDFFGNPTEEMALMSDHSKIVFTATARVNRSFAGPGDDVSGPLATLPAALAAWRELDGTSPHHFLHASPRIHPAAPMTDYARAAIKGARSVRGAVEALGMALHRDMTFDSRTTTVDTPPDEAFERRTGVCQDFAQVMIAALRGIGIPAGYVSGFLRTVPPPGKPRLEGADAMHAWVRAWCGPEAGWVEFDPTNACLVGADHIVVAYGRDYGDVAPVAGVLRISGKQKSKQAVDVIAL